jgi:hypothetical protein
LRVKLFQQAMRGKERAVHMDVHVDRTHGRTLALYTC